jgi:hypothetical protein
MADDRRRFRPFRRTGQGSYVRNYTFDGRPPERRPFRRMGQGDYVRDYGFSEAYDQENRSYRHPFQRIAPGDYVRNYTFTQRPGREDWDRMGYGAREQDFDRGERLDRYGVAWEDNKDWGVPGPFAGVGPRGYRRSDESIRDEVCERLTRHGQIDATDIEVSVENGEVTLIGNVDSRHTKRLAEDTVEGVRGLQDVHNHLRVRR